MDEFFAAKSASNDRILCIGPLARAEAPEASDVGLGDGTGLFVYLTTASSGGKAIDILARVASPEAAETMSRLLGFEAPQDS